MALSTREWALVGSIVAADRITKLVAESLRPESLWFSYVRNTGAGFGIFRDYNGILAVIAAAALVAIYFILRKPNEYSSHERIAIIILGAGVIGNLWDRIQYQYVIDFIAILSPTGFPVFNIADSAITLSVAYLVAMTLRSTYAGWAFGSKQKQTRTIPTSKKK